MQLFENIYFINAYFASFNKYLTITLTLSLLFAKCWFLFSNNSPDTGKIWAKNGRIIFEVVKFLNIEAKVWCA